MSSGHRKLLLGTLGLALGASLSFGGPAPSKASTPIFDETAEFSHRVDMSGTVDSSMQVSLVLDFESTNRKIPGMGNLDGLPIPVMVQKKHNEVLHLEPGKDGRYQISFDTFMKSRFGTHYMLRHASLQIDQGGRSRTRPLFGTHVFFGETGVPCESLKRVRVSPGPGTELKLQLDGEREDLSKYTFGLIPDSGPATQVHLDFTR